MKKVLAGRYSGSVNLQGSDDVRRPHGSNLAKRVPLHIQRLYGQAMGASAFSAAAPMRI